MWDHTGQKNAMTNVKWPAKTNPGPHRFTRLDSGRYWSCFWIGPMYLYCNITVLLRFSIIFGWLCYERISIMPGLLAPGEEKQVWATLIYLFRSDMFSRFDILLACTIFLSTIITVVTQYHVVELTNLMTSNRNFPTHYRRCIKMSPPCLQLYPITFKRLTTLPLLIISISV